jgi:hypothetical protein
MSVKYRQRGFGEDINASDEQANSLIHARCYVASRWRLRVDCHIITTSRAACLRFRLHMVYARHGYLHLLHA